MLRVHPKGKDELLVHSWLSDLSQAGALSMT